MPAGLAVSLSCDDAAAVIDWLCRAFGFAQRLVVPGPNGSVVHSETTLGNAVIYVSSPKRGLGPRFLPQRSNGGPRLLLDDSEPGLSRECAAFTILSKRVYVGVQKDSCGLTTRTRAGSSLSGRSLCG